MWASNHANKFTEEIPISGFALLKYSAIPYGILTCRKSIYWLDSIQLLL